MVQNDGVDQTGGIKFVLILDGRTGLCMIGFLGTNVAALKKLSKKFVNTFFQVI